VRDDGSEYNEDEAMVLSDEDEEDLSLLLASPQQPEAATEAAASTQEKASSWADTMLTNHKILVHIDPAEQSLNSTESIIRLLLEEKLPQISQDGKHSTPLLLAPGQRLPASMRKKKAAPAKPKYYSMQDLRDWMVKYAALAHQKSKDKTPQQPLLVLFWSHADLLPLSVAEGWVQSAINEWRQS
jgi:hypothetical protein